MALQKQVITAGDADRSYLVAGPPPGAPVSAVIMSLHGTRSTADRQARLSGFGQLVRTASAVVVFPRAIEPIGTGYEWDPSQDVDYIAGLAAELLSRHRVPHGRVLLTGMSGGARMSSLFASVHPKLVQAVGAVAGLRSPASRCTGRSRSCRSTGRTTGSTRTGAAKTGRLLRYLEGEEPAVQAGDPHDLDQ